ncbi:CYFA0S01e03356g1_1 [Cyberlindnera fabianii]|uniref:Pre-mRNA-splicing factor 38 n=1 Tax=Cyberlindnera fabianii TaxID=36022 RepID=A0A061AGI0_CYBFA|nr:CYFA0S01e03356g1_1 [Cyberlindnera fabianii]
MSRDRGIIVDRELSHAFHNGINTTLLIEKIVRERVFDSLYYKQFCFNVNAATLLDRAVELACIGSFEQSGRPFPFLCLLVKLIQLAPQREIIDFYISQERFKYLRVLGLLYVRIVYRDLKSLRPYLEDYRKLRLYEHGEWRLCHVDEVVDKLLNDEFFIGLKLTYTQKEE